MKIKKKFKLHGCATIGNDYRRRKLSGRQPGTLNKFTSLKNSFVNAFKALGAEEGLIEWAESDPRNMAMFFRIVGSMLPKDISMTVEGADTLAETLIKARKAKEAANKS